MRVYIIGSDGIMLCRTELSPNFGDGLKIRRRLEARQKCR
jgi:hypothetical protein